MQHFDCARLSPNSVRNAVWHALNEPVCQYLRMRNPRCSTVYIDNSLRPLATDSPCMTWHCGDFVQLPFQWKSNKYYIFLVCVCSLRYPACNAHAPYYIVICVLPNSTIYFCIALKLNSFRKSLLNIKFVFFMFSTNIVSKISHSKKNSARYYHKCS